MIGFVFEIQFEFRNFLNLIYHQLRKQLNEFQTLPNFIIGRM